VDPTELPPISYPGPNGPVFVSDVLVNGINNQAGLPPFIALVSDNNPDLQTIVPMIPAGTPVLTETGTLQDLTALMGPSILPPVGPITVQVQSDVSSVPEPSSLAVLGAGAVGLLAYAWRRRKQAV
jgi:hypothetical protein